MTTDERRPTSDERARGRAPEPHDPLTAGAAGSPARAHNRLASFGYAFAGIGYLLRTQRNAQIHCAIALIAALLGILLRIGLAEWLAVTIMITIVIAAEGVNTAIEAAVDLASPQRHPLAKIAKDVAAGTVLITAIGAVAVGLLIFLPPLLRVAATLIGWPL
jgi:diacylglycerol kinase (ATP)